MLTAGALRRIRVMSSLIIPRIYTGFTPRTDSIAFYLRILCNSLILAKSRRELLANTTSGRIEDKMKNR